MDKKEFMERTGELLPGVLEYLKAETDRLFRSGAIDPDDYNAGEFALPKIVLTVALENCADQFKPAAWDKAKNADVKNLRKF